MSFCISAGEISTNGVGVALRSNKFIVSINYWSGEAVGVWTFISLDSAIKFEVDLLRFNLRGLMTIKSDASCLSGLKRFC